MEGFAEEMLIRIDQLRGDGVRRKGTPGRGNSTSRDEAAGKPIFQEGGIVWYGLWGLYLGRGEGWAGVKDVRSTEARAWRVHVTCYMDFI